MKVWILNLEYPDQPLSVSVHELMYEKENGNFSMSCPRGDDWLQRINHVQEPAPVFVHQSKQQTVVVFEQIEIASNFLIWLKNANSEAHHGFATMRG